ncbi:site-specific integrase [Pseudomonas sp. NY11382]|uniref:site-specific integrase n=1 Tax=Pseudomonas sp. NY11382 TaxID=2939495 RepID=UPI0022DE6C36|nr:site-specific integrase [Pseudomonas sp. NY11382]WBM33657.1 site-specific integrase [Pseudomonas sp. NY11382]
MALIAQPFRHPDSGIYYLRRRVPDDLRQIIGKTEIRRSLHTRHHQQAKAAFALAYAESERLFNNARQGLCIEPCKPETVGKPLPAPSLHAPAESSIRLSEALTRYVQSISMSGRSEYVLRRHAVDYSRAVNRYITDMGDKPIASIQPSDIHAFAAKLIQPADENVKPLATSSTRLLLARLSSVMAFTVDSGLLEINPVTTSRIHKRLGSGKAKRRLDDNRGYTWGELVTLFSHPEFQRLRYTEGRPGNAVFWIPLIAAYTGGRREEIAQLYVDDIHQHEGASWFIRVIDDRPDKSVKTDSSRREIPVHPDLIALGLLTLVQGRAPGTRVFPQLVKVSDGFAGIVSKSWRPITQRCGVYQPGRNPLHAFRHSFKTLAREHGIPKEVSDWITGHASGHIGDSYGINPLPRMAIEIQKLPSIAKAAGLLPN